jgi:hypothetical protein
MCVSEGRTVVAEGLGTCRLIAGSLAAGVFVTERRALHSDGGASPGGASGIWEQLGFSSPDMTGGQRTVGTVGKIVLCLGRQVSCLTTAAHLALDVYDRLVMDP